VSDRMGRCKPNENWCESTRECVGEGLTCPSCSDGLHVFCGANNFDIKGSRRCCESEEICSQNTNPDNNPYKKTARNDRQARSEKEPIERRSQMKAKLEERIESDKQELAALDALDTVSEQDEEEGVKQLAANYVPQSDGNIGDKCAWVDYNFMFKVVECKSACCENNRCVAKKRDWFGVYYCPAECKGWAFAPGGTC